MTLASDCCQITKMLGNAVRYIQRRLVKSMETLKRGAHLERWGEVNNGNMPWMVHGLFGDDVMICYAIFHGEYHNP